jgi:hypothetical protein
MCLNSVPEIFGSTRKINDLAVVKEIAHKKGFGNPILNKYARLV